MTVEEMLSANVTATVGGQEKNFGSLRGVLATLMVRTEDDDSRSNGVLEAAQAAAQAGARATQAASEATQAAESVRRDVAALTALVQQTHPGGTQGLTT